ncbi:MAG: RNA polymerase factor sigma-54 [Gemmataceae bacterium]
MSSLGLNLSPRMEHSLQLRIAPKMIQSMEILQLPVMALQEKIQQELDENPVLERKDAKAKETGEVEPDFNPDAPLKHDETGDLEFNRLEELNKDWDDHFNEEHRISRGAIDELGDKKLEAMQNAASAPQTLQDHLAEQLTYLDLKPDQLALVEFVISHLDENGYLVTHDRDRNKVLELTADDLARAYPTPVTLADVEDAIFLVQELDPAGVGARNAKECLLLQIDDETPHANLVRQLIEHHLEDVGYNRLPAIQKRTNASPEEIREAIDVLKHLDPKPGAKFAAESTQYVTPDIIVNWNDDGGFDIRLTDEWLPSVRISKKYIELAKSKETDAKTREFLKRKLTSASWLQEAIAQRKRTLTNVTREIINAQKDFIDRGPDFIKPLKMEEIADKVGVHVTTVSRAVDDKWVQTPRGVFPLKRFFGGGTVNAITGETVAWETIKQKLFEIVGAEDKLKPLSDDDIVEKLKDAGLTVARRTVTKYREALNIPSSRQRREWNK